MTPRRAYVAIRLGVLEDALDAGVSKGAALLLARVLTHRDKRSVPGLLRVGIAGLAESLRASKSHTSRELSELQSANLILNDARERLIYVMGAIETDGPKTENSVRGMAQQIRELPPDSPVTREVRRAIFAALSKENDGKASAWLATWQSLAGPEPASDTRPDLRPDSGPDSGPHARARVPIPIPIPRSDPEIRSRSQQQPATSKAVPHAPDRRTSEI